MKMSSIAKTSFFLVSNYHTYGIQHAMEHFLEHHHAKQICFLNHPLHAVPCDLSSTIVWYGGTVPNSMIKRKKLPIPLNYAVDVFITLQVGLKLKEPLDVYVGFNSMNTIPGLVLKLFGKVRKVVTYSHSVKDQRFAQPILNWLYKKIDLTAVHHSDFVWGLGSSLRRVRLSQGVAAKYLERCVGLPRSGYGSKGGDYLSAI